MDFAPRSAEEPPESNSSPTHDGPAWERPHVRGTLAALRETIAETLQRPVPTFQTMRRDRGTRRALLFYLLTSAASLPLAVAANQFVAAAVPALHPFVGKPVPVGQLAVGLLFSPVCFGLILAPLQYVFVAFYHGLLTLFGAGRNGYAATFRVASYGVGSLAVISWIPVVGPFAAFAWCAYLYVVGTREVHETSTVRAVLSFAAAMAIPLAILASVWKTLAPMFGGDFPDLPVNEI